MKRPQRSLRGNDISPLADLHPSATGTERHGAMSDLSPECAGGLNRSMQHFILKGKDGVRNGTKIS
jgi:hypothetical protein